MNKEWLGLIIPLWFLLYFLGYFSVIPAIYEGDEDVQVNKWWSAISNWCLHNIGRLYVVVMGIVLPIVFLGFTFGYFQRKTNDQTKKVFCHVVGALNAVLIFAIYKYASSNS